MSSSIGINTKRSATAVVVCLVNARLFLVLDRQPGISSSRGSPPARGSGRATAVLAASRGGTCTGRVRSEQGKALCGGGGSRENGSGHRSAALSLLVVRRCDEGLRSIGSGRQPIGGNSQACPGLNLHQGWLSPASVSRSATADPNALALLGRGRKRCKANFARRTETLR
jgi:hypothetical protein